MDHSNPGGPLGDRLRHVQDILDLALAEVSALVGEADGVFGSGERQIVPGISWVPGMDGTVRKLESLALNCQTEVWSFQPTVAFSEEQVEAARRANDDSFERGIRMRGITGVAVRNNPVALAQIATSVKRGAEYRTVPVVPSQIFVVDQELVVVLAKETLGESRGVWVISDPAMVQLLAELFRVLWRMGEPLLADTQLPERGLSAQERAALREWARGATDAQVASALGVSARTVRRIGESLARTLAASSRFELAAKATLEGWITEDDVR